MATVVSTTTEDLLERVRELEPLIRAHSEEAERERRLSAPVVEALRDAGLFRMFRPMSRGGLELDPVSFFRVVEAISRIDAAAGWNVQISNAGEPFGAWFSDEATEEIFGSPDAVTAGAFNPKRRAVPVEGGYRVSGRTAFNSNCHAATSILGLANIFDGDGPEPRMGEDGHPIDIITVFRASDAEIVDNWNTMGMRGTGSHDVVLDDLFLPEHHTALFVPLDELGEAYSGPLYRLSVWPVIAGIAAPALGIAQAAIDDLVAMGVKVPAYTERSLRDRNMVQLRLGTASAKLSAARAFLHETFDAMWQRALDGHPLDQEHKAQCQMASSHAVMASAEAVDLVHACVGATGIRNEASFQKYFRDVHVITQHAFICESRLESVGQILLELEPEWPFFAF